MATATITVRLPETEKREASRILRARGTTLAKRLRSVVREIIEDEEDAADLALATERLKNSDPASAVPDEEVMRELGISQADIDAAECPEIE